MPIYLISEVYPREFFNSFFFSLQLGEVFNEQQDVARACRQALWRLAFTRPHLIILTLSLMLRRLGPQTLNAMLTAVASSTNVAGISGGDGSQKILRVVVSSPALAAPILSGEALPKGNIPKMSVFVCLK